MVELYVERDCVWSEGTIENRDGSQKGFLVLLITTRIEDFKG